MNENKEDIYAEKRKSANVALVLSAIVPGLGQVYNGQIIKGITLLIFFLISLSSIYTLLITLLSTIGIWIYGMFQAYNIAQEIEKNNIQIKKTSTN